MTSVGWGVIRDGSLKAESEKAGARCQGNVLGFPSAVPRCSCLGSTGAWPVEGKAGKKSPFMLALG